MIAAEEEQELKINVELIEYLASFWNAEGVKKIREYRERRENPHIDEEFVEAVESGNYKENPLIKALQKINENANLDDNDVKPMKTPKIRRVRAPIDLDELSRTTKI